MAKQAWGGVVQNREEQHRLKRQVVLKVAAETIRRQGYSQTTLTDVAKALHISKPALYYYFKSKDQIMFEIQHLAIDMLLEASPTDPRSPFLPGLDVQTRLARFVRRYVEMITSDYGACLILTSRQALEPDSRKRLIGALKPINQLMKDVLRDGMTEGWFAPADIRLTSGFIFGALNWIPTWYRSDDATSLADLSEAMVAYIVGALNPPATAPAPAPLLAKAAR